MKSVLDATALVAVLQAEPGARAVAAAAPNAIVASINLAEARDHLARSVGSPVRAAAAIGALLDRGLRVTSCDRDLAEMAADLRATHYHRVRAPVSLADCFAVALAQRDGRMVVSSDADQLRVAREVGVEVHPIANSSGVVPQV